MQLQFIAGWQKHTSLLLYYMISHFQLLLQSFAIDYSNGVGRTGVFIALSILIDRMKLESAVNVFTTIKRLRLQRTAMVQTLVCTNRLSLFVFLHGTIYLLFTSKEVYLFVTLPFVSSLLKRLSEGRVQNLIRRIFILFLMFIMFLGNLSRVINIFLILCC